MYAVTFAISAGVRMRFVVRARKEDPDGRCRHPRRARDVTNAGPMSILPGVLGCRPTLWQALQASRAKACPAMISPSCAFALNKAAARTAPTTATRPARPSSFLM